jgi:hypothetical protein
MRETPLPARVAFPRASLLGSYLGVVRWVGVLNILKLDGEDLTLSLELDRDQGKGLRSASLSDGPRALPKDDILDNDVPGPDLSSLDGRFGLP